MIQGAKNQITIALYNEETVTTWNNSGRATRRKRIVIKNMAAFYKGETSLDDASIDI